MVTTNSQDLQATSTQEEKHAEPFLLNIGTLIGELNEFRASNGASLLTKQVSDWRSPASYQSWWEAAVLERFVSYLGGVLTYCTQPITIWSYGLALRKRTDKMHLAYVCLVHSGAIEDILYIDRDQNFWSFKMKELRHQGFEPRSAIHIQKKEMLTPSEACARFTASKVLRGLYNLLQGIVTERKKRLISLETRERSLGEALEMLGETELATEQ